MKGVKEHSTTQPNAQTVLCRAQGERQCLGPPLTQAEHRNFLERLRLAAHEVKQAARNIGDPMVEATEVLLNEIRVAQGIVRRVSFLQHRATAAQASQYSRRSSQA
jgi:hypothetical protein